MSSVVQWGFVPARTERRPHPLGGNTGEVQPCDTPCIGHLLDISKFLFACLQATPPVYDRASAGALAKRTRLPVTMAASLNQSCAGLCFVAYSNVSSAASFQQVKSFMRPLVCISRTVSSHEACWHSSLPDRKSPIRSATFFTWTHQRATAKSWHMLTHPIGRPLQITLMTSVPSASPRTRSVRLFPSIPRYHSRLRLFGHLQTLPP